MIDFSDRLRWLREQHGYTKYRLAKLSGITKEGIANLERPHADPKLSTLRKLATALNIPLCELLPREKRTAGRGATNTRPA
jgi:transcriptional regulator with XRE-family HTH domain